MARDAYLDGIMKKVLAREPTTRKQMREQTAVSTGAVIKAPTVRKSYDVSGDAKRVKKATSRPKALSPKERVARAVQGASKTKERPLKRIPAASPSVQRTEIPDPLTMIIHAPLPKHKSGKPNVAALLYAHQAFLQYQHAFNRRNLGDARERHAYYLAAHERFRKTMEELGMADFFEWQPL